MAAEASRVCGLLIAALRVECLSFRGSEPRFLHCALKVRSFAPLRSTLLVVCRTRPVPCSNPSREDPREFTVCERRPSRAASAPQLRSSALSAPIAMGASTSRAKPVPERPPVPAGKVRVCVAGFAVSHNVGRAASVARAIVANSPDQFESWFYFDDQGARHTIRLALLCSWRTNA